MCSCICLLAVGLAQQTVQHRAVAAGAVGIAAVDAADGCAGGAGLVQNVQIDPTLLQIDGHVLPFRE